MSTKISTKMCARYTQAYILTKIAPFFFLFFLFPLYAVQKQASFFHFYRKFV